MVVFVSNPAYRNDEGGNHSNRQRIELDQLSMHELAGEAVFVVAQFDHRLGKVADEFGQRMFTHLKMSALPTISVIAPRTDRLTEIYRMEGLFEANDIANDLSRLFRQRDGKQVVDVPHEAPKLPERNLLPTFEFNRYELQPQ